MSLQATRSFYVCCDGCGYRYKVSDQKEPEAFGKADLETVDVETWEIVPVKGSNRHYCRGCAQGRLEWLGRLREEGELPTEEVRTAMPNPDAPNPLGSPPS